MDYKIFGIKFIIDLLFIFVFSYFLYYKQHKNYQSLVTYFLFNIFIFLIIYFLSNENINLSIWFAIFWLVGMIRLRSDTIDKIEIVYFIWSLTMAIVNSLITWDIVWQILLNLVICILTFIVDNKFISNKVFKQLDITLDYIPKKILTDKNYTLQELADYLNIDLVDFEVQKIDNIRDSVKITIVYK